MKKNLVSIIMVIAILSAAFTMAIAQGPKDVRFVSSTWSSNTYKMNFQVMGYKSFPAAFNVNHQSFAPACSWDGVKKLVCSVQLAKRYVGQTATVWIAGHVFYVKVK